MKKVVILSTLLTFLSSISFAVQDTGGGAIRFAKLETGRVLVEACKKNLDSSLTCTGIRNPRGYTVEDLASLSGTPNKVGSVVLGTAEIAVAVVLFMLGGFVAGAMSDAGLKTAGAALAFGPAGGVILVSNVVNFLNARRQWKKGTIKDLMSKDGRDSSSIVFATDKEYKRSVAIVTEVLKKLPSDSTY